MVQMCCKLHYFATSLKLEAYDIIMTWPPSWENGYLVQNPLHIFKKEKHSLRKKSDLQVWYMENYKEKALSASFCTGSNGAT